jgi:hypothetical protein
MFSWQHMRITNPLYLSSRMPFGTSGTVDNTRTINDVATNCRQNANGTENHIREEILIQFSSATTTR